MIKFKFKTRTGHKKIETGKWTIAKIDFLSGRRQEPVTQLGYWLTTKDVNEPLSLPKIKFTNTR